MSDFNNPIIIQLTNLQNDKTNIIIKNITHFTSINGKKSGTIIWFTSGGNETVKESQQEILNKINNVEEWL